MKFSAWLLAVLLVAPQLFVVAPAIAQSNTRDGCMNQWLFNGVWRARITSVEPYMNGDQQTGWQVTETWRNGTSRELAPADSMLLTQNLVLGSGTLPAQANRQQGLAYNTLAPAGQYTYKQTFLSPNGGPVDPANKPKALDVPFDAAKVALSNKPHFTNSKVNFHYDLTCVASGEVAQAEGGSTQLDATEGCMNQWMSNGVWKMRVTAIAPFPPDAPPANQTAWRVAQEWVNVTARKLYPGVTPDASQNVVQSNVSDEFLATKNGNNASSFNTAGGLALGSRNVPFPPGGSFQFQQLIGWSPFDATDTPTRLLVTFDAARQNALPNAPHYTKPANFRINLTCGTGAVSLTPASP